MKNLFAPFGLVGGMIAGLIGKKLFDFAWRLVDDQEPPEPDQRRASWLKLGAALVAQGAIFRLVRGLVERGTRAGFYRATGLWPGEEEPDPA